MSRPLKSCTHWPLSDGSAAIAPANEMAEISRTAKVEYGTRTVSKIEIPQPKGS
jgi:hypothetical protein